MSNDGLVVMITAFQAVERGSIPRHCTKMEHSKVLDSFLARFRAFSPLEAEVRRETVIESLSRTQRCG